ncbi:hypothetical protein RF11_15248 [Thelohanellus kitauei]|uniref:Uncharacterized protein n=1 Tax=Thelohanellus kitauei TaxID=669202 RepID=A0A0C2MYQ7_THEKT|nr:hypothetical protein RF11_15248 [Thelohanellus kitauei]
MQNPNSHLDISSAKTPRRQAFGEIGNQPRDFITNPENLKPNQSTSIHSRSSYPEIKIPEGVETLGPFIDESDINVIGNFPGFERANNDPKIWQSCIEQLFFVNNPKYLMKHKKTPILPFEIQQNPEPLIDDLPLPDYDYKYD